MVRLSWGWVAALQLLGVCAVASPVSTRDAPVSQAVAGREKLACQLLSAKYPKQTLVKGSARYTFETQTQYWSATAYNTPACVFVPIDAQQVSYAVTVTTLTLTKFAVRGGGHMPVVGYDSIGSSGFLLALTNLTALALSKHRATVSVGPGHRWVDVYSYLQPYNLTALGGRVGGVGVPGLLLGGGISFHSSQYGFAADNVVSYQAVLANGKIIDATATNAYSDLYWALKGGGNSFAIVTGFQLRTIPSPGVWVGIAAYAETDSAKYLDAVYSFGEYGSADSKAAIIPTIVVNPSPANKSVTYAAAKFYDSLSPPTTAFENFSAPVLTPVFDQFALQPLADYVKISDALQPTGLRQEFRTVSMLVDRGAISYLHDTFIGALDSSLSGVADITASFTFQPVTKDFIQNGVKRGGPNPQGLDASKAPYFWVVINLSWTDPSDDDTCRGFAKTIADELEAGLTSRGVGGGYLYMNDAGSGQPIFQNYPAANLKRLKSIRSKYDPLRIYTNLLTGGWKVLDA